MEISQALDALSALAQESRLKVFRMLVRAGSEGLPAGVIADELGVPPATLSFHLSHLTRAGLTESRREGRSIIYALRVDAVRELMGFLIEDCCKGRPELCAPVLPELLCRGPGEGRKGKTS
jgi:ArsR family transcriptional regulator